MGDRDLIKPLLERNGTVHFGRVLMKPGKPLTFATLTVPSSAAAGGAGPQPHSMMVVGLPGNPVSSFACFHLVALPALRKMMGWAQPMLRRIQVRDMMRRDQGTGSGPTSILRLDTDWSPSP